MGKTSQHLTRIRDAEKHPHVCGEDDVIGQIIEPYQETPPRVWGRHQHIVFSGVLKRQIYNNCTPQGFRISINIHQTKKYVTI